MTKVELPAASWIEKNVMGSQNLLLLSHHLVRSFSLILRSMTFLSFSFLSFSLEISVLIITIFLPFIPGLGLPCCFIFLHSKSLSHFLAIRLESNNSHLLQGDFSLFSFLFLCFEISKIFDLVVLFLFFLFLFWFFFLGIFSDTKSNHCHPRSKIHLL